MLSKKQLFVLLLTYSTYAMIYMTRKPFSVVKKSFMLENDFSKMEAGYIETGFLAAYAIGQFLCGSLGDRFGAKLVLVVGYLGSAASTYFFSHSVTLSEMIFYWSLNGFFQAGAFPLMMKVINPWFTKSQRGVVIGVWTTCQQVGGMLSSKWASDLTSDGWRTAVLRPAICVLVSAAFLTLIPKGPTEARSNVSIDKKDDRLSNDSPKSPKAQLSFTQVLFLPGILNYGLAYFFVKLIRYLLLNWLPTYLEEFMNYSPRFAGTAPILFDLGGAFGSVGCGLIADVFLKGRRNVILLPCCLVVFISLILFAPLSSYGMFYNLGIMTLIGLAIAAPDSMLGGVCTADACELARESESLGTAAGIVNGIGSIGAILQGILAGYVIGNYGWNCLFTLLGVFSLIAAFLLLPNARAEFKGIKLRSIH